MKPASPFTRFDDADVRDLIAEYPLAWVCPLDGADPTTSALLPLLGDYDSQGRLVSLTGHLARRNPLTPILETAPRVLLLFTGPQAYVSPACVSDSAWAPTWNYAQLRIETTVHVLPDHGDEVLARLVEAMDHDPATGWRAANVGDRYRAMERAILAFRADVTRVEGRFKLGQDEKPERLREIFARHPDPALVRWMRRFNAQRV
jgi:transcriptional regulator